MGTAFDYTPNIVEATNKGLTWNETMAEMASARFTELGMTQEQVTGSVSMHLHFVAWQFTPRNYTLKQRIAIACHFLFGKGPL